MSQISIYTDAVNAAFATIETNTDILTTAMTGVSGDVAELKRIINELQTNPGPISPADQALLDAGVTRVQALSDKLAPLAAAAKALDEATENPPVPGPVG